MSKSSVAPGIDLVPAPGDRNAMIGQTGSGKSYASRAIVERLVRLCPTIVIDPTGVWWGLRSTAAGKPIEQPPIPIIGGAHGDVPLDPARGAVYARWIVSGHGSAILDLSGDLGRGEARRFVTAFISELYRIKGTDRTPTHVVIDEADEFAPQQPRGEGDAAKSLSAIDQLVRRGRSRGIGFTLITQRPAVLNKDVLNMASNLVFLKVTGPTDINAVGEWVKYHGEKADQQRVMGSLSSLPVGLGWWWLTESNTLVQTRVHPITTFDSMKAPSMDDVAATLGTVDLGALSAEIATMVEEAKASDPAVLKARIASLEMELKHQGKTLPTQAGDLLKSQQRVQELMQDLADMKWRAEHWQRVATELNAAIVGAGKYVTDAVREAGGIFEQPKGPGPAAKASSAAKPSSVAPILSTPSTPRYDSAKSEKVNGQADTFSKSARAVLDGLRWVEVFLRDPEVDDRRLALITGIAPGGSTMRGAKAELKKTDAIEYPRQGVTSLTTEGRKLANEPDPAMTRDGLHDQVCKRLSERPASLLRVLIAAYPEPMDGPTMAAGIGLDEPNGSSMRGYKAELAGMGLIEYPKPGWARAVDALFPDTLR